MRGLGHIADAVARELGRFGPVAGMADIVAAWPEAVGPAIARQAWPARIARDGTLYVTTSSSAWAFELTQLEEQARTQLARLVGDAAPARIRFAVGRLPATGSDSHSKEKRNVPIVNAAARDEGERIASEISDPALREMVARAAAASFASARSAPDDR
jgi:hypothetical protein